MKAKIAEDAGVRNLFVDPDICGNKGAAMIRTQGEAGTAGVTQFKA